MHATAATEDDSAARDTLVLGIGNLLWADEGFGVRCVERMHARFRFPEGVCVMDGGTQGIFLLPWVRAAERLLIFDAIDFGLEAATLRVIRDADVPRYMGAKKVSMHQAGFQEVLSAAQLSGECPRELVLIGVQPLLLNDYGGSLTPAVKAQVEPAVASARDALSEWGITLNPRTAPPAATELTGPEALALGDYERDRPQFEGQTQ